MPRILGLLHLVYPIALLSNYTVAHLKRSSLPVAYSVLVIYILSNYSGDKMNFGMAAEMATLEEVKSVAQKSNANLRTMGVALAPCTAPAAGEDEMEMGMGIHGE